jgi:hypothetical protein
MKRKPKRTHVPKLPSIPAAQEDLNATSAALYDPDPTDGEDTSVRGAESVEDPLDDWPETDTGADEWLKERHCRGDDPAAL